ncbi:amino acid/polyamine transporter I [Apiospora arundinis]
MPDCEREDSPETAALFENYSQRRVLKATYEEKKDRFAKEAEALQEEKDRIAQELRKVDTKYNALQAKLAQLSAGYEADKTGLSHSLRRMLGDIAVTPGGIMPTQLVAVQRGRGGCAKTYKQSAWCNTYWSRKQTPASLLFHSRDNQPDSPFARFVYEEYKGGCERVIIPAWAPDRYKRYST